MRSGISCFDRTVFKKTLLRFWPLWGAYAAIWLIALPLNGVTMLQLSAFSQQGGADYMRGFAYEMVPALSGMCLFMAVVFGVLSAMAAFSHLYNARSANFFGALPIRREGLFLTHYLAGLAFLIVPNAVIFLLTLAVELAGGCVYLPGLLFWLAVSCGECLFFYSMAVFCGLFTGHLLALPAFYGIFNALAVAVMGLSYVTLNAFYYGYAGPGDWMETVMRWLTPVWKLAVSVRGDYYFDGNSIVPVLEGAGTVGVYALIGLALAAGAFFLYRARRLESAGDVVSVRPMRPVFKYGVALMAGLSFGYLTTFFLSVRETGLMIAIVVWGIVGYFAAQMLLDKSFKVFHKWKGAAAVTGVFIVLFLVVGLDLTGFETRIPNEADVASVEVSGLNWGWYNDNGDYIDLELDDPQSIRLMMDLHRAAVDLRTMDFVDRISYNGRAVSFSLTYHLTDGSTMSRQYYVSFDPVEMQREGTTAWALERIFTDRDLYWRVYGFDTLEQRLANGGRLENAGYRYYRYGENYVDDVCYYYGEDARTLLSAVEEDFWAGRIGMRHAGYDDPDYQRNVSFEVRYGDDRRQTVSIFVPDGATSTLAALDKMADRAVRPETNLDGYDW